MVNGRGIHYVLRVCVACLVAVLVLISGSARAAGTVPAETKRVYQCIPNDGVRPSKQGDDPVSLANYCYGSSYAYSWGSGTYYFVRCDTGATVSPMRCFRTHKQMNPSGEVISDAEDGAVNYVGFSQQVGCPADSTAAGGSCTCNAGKSPSADGKTCDAACEQNNAMSSGYYDVGTSAGASPLLFACRGNCKVFFDGSSPAGSALVGGQKHWYAKGTYYASGGKCSASEQGAKQIGEASSAKPEDKCADGQGWAKMNGKMVCVDQGGDGKTTTDESTDKAATKTEKKTETNPDGSTTTTETTTKTDAKGNKEVTVTRTTTAPDGSVKVETETKGSLPSSGGSQSPDEGEQPGECEKNPSAAGCGGSASPIGTLYSAKDKTLSSVLGAHRDSFMSSPFGSAAGQFFLVSGGGSCPTFTRHIPFVDVDLTIDQFCSEFGATALLILKGALLVACSFFAFRVAVE